MSITLCAAFKYSEALTPAGYACSNCKLTGVRLFRAVHGAQDAKGRTLWCLRCGVILEKEAHGRWPDNDYTAIDQQWYSLGYLVAAVPTEQGGEWWGMGSTPRAGWLWWESLPMLTVVMFAKVES